MLIRGADVVNVIKSLRPPFDAETQRELIAVAYGSNDAKARTVARKLLDKHVPSARVFPRMLGAGFHRAHDGSARLRRVKYPERGKLAVAMRAHGAYVAGVAFEEDDDFARDRLPRLVKNGVLDLHEWYMTPNSVESLELSRIPDIVFDELPRLHAKHAFHSLTLWGSPPHFSQRFREFAPYIRKLRIGYCDLERLPDVVCELTKLEELSIDEPKLVALNPRLKKLKALKRLHISRASKMKTLPSEVCALPNLEELSLFFFRMKELPPAIGALKKLAKLSLYSSHITKLPDELAQLPLRHVIVTPGRMESRLKQLAPTARFKSNLA